MKTSVLITIVFLALQSKNGKLVDGSSRKTKHASSSSYHVERFGITTPPNDKCRYRGLRLKNDLKVVLVSDPSTVKSAAAMVVGVGGLNDFRDIPGITNLVGYMLMNSSKKYPIVHDFDHFLIDRGGSTDLPVTRAHDQSFSFDIDPAYLADALDRFSNLFAGPLMHHTSARSYILEYALKFLPIELERRAIFDEFRIAEVEKSLCKENHQYCHFFLGTKELLYQHTKAIAESSEEEKKTESLFQKVRTFHSFWYSSNIMTLAVLGREGLNQLEKMVIPLFEKIENKNRKRLMYSYENHPCGPEQLKHKVYIVPASSNLQLLRLSFPVPDVGDKHRTSPDVYIGNLIADGGPGNLYALLAKMNLCENVETLFRYCYMAGISFFIIQLELTDMGVERVDDVIHLIFQYIYLLREKGIQKWVFNEQKELYKVDFVGCGSSDNDPLDYMEQLAYSMQGHPMQEILTYNYTLGEWNPLLIENFMTYLRPDNMNVSIVSKSSANFADQQERYYGTRYGIVKIPDELIKKWGAKESFPSLALPFLYNEFLPENVDLHPLNENEPKDPYLIHHSAISEIWFKQDDKFRVPKLYIKFELHSPISRLDPGQRMLFCVFNHLLRLSLSKYLNPASLAGLNWDIEMESIHIQVTLDGSSDKLPVLLENILSKITHFVNEPNGVDNFKDTWKLTLESYRDSFTEDHHFQLEWYTDYLQSLAGWDMRSVIKAGEKLQYDDMRIFLSKIFRRIFIRGFIHGNCTRQKAMDIVNIIENAFKSSGGLLVQEILPPRAVEIAQGFHFVVQAYNEKSDMYAYSSHFQLHNNSLDPKHEIATVLFYEIVEKLCHDVMSGQSQRKVPEINCELSQINGVQGFTISAAPVTDPRQMNRKVERFLRDAHDLIRSLSDNELKRRKMSVRTERWTEPTNLYNLSEVYWNEIEKRRYIFDSYKTELELLRSINRTDLLSYFKEMFYGASTDRRRQLTVHVSPKNREKATPRLLKNIPVTAINVENLEDFKSASSVLPHHLRPTPSVWR